MIEKGIDVLDEIHGLRIKNLKMMGFLQMDIDKNHAY